MKEKISEKISIPEGIECTYENKIFKCKKGSLELSRPLEVHNVRISIKDSEITFEADKATKRELKMVKTAIAHIKNIIFGSENKFVYKLEACNVHFPMTLKKESNLLMINNFLGEKIPRYAKILPNVDIDIKGPKITLSSNDKEAAGQTAANIEKATKIRNRDRRIFQDGIFIVEKPGAES